MKLSPRLRRWLIRAAAILVVYAIAGFFVAPPILRTQLEKQAGAALERTVTIAGVRMNPFALSITIDGLHIADHDGGELASWQRAYLNFDPTTSLLRREWHLGAVSLVEPRQRFAIDREGRLNIADLLAPTTPDEPAEETPGLPAVGVGRLEISNWTVDFTDESHVRAFHTVAGPMSFSVRDFSTRADASSAYQFSGATDSNERFSWSGTLSVQPLASQGRFELKDFLLPKHMPYADQFLAAELRTGRLSLASDYAVTLDGPLSATLANTSFALADVAVQAGGAQEPAVTLANLDIIMPKADLTARTAEVTRVAITGLRVNATRRSDGTMDLPELLAPPPATASPSDATADPQDTGPAPSVRIDEITLADAAVNLTDETTPRPAQLRIDQVRMRATNAGTDLDREISLDASLRWQESGTLKAHGTVRLLPFAAHIEVAGDDLALAPLENHLEAQARVRIADGRLRFAGTVDASQPPRDKLELHWSGDVAVDDLATTDGVSGADLLAWKSFAISGLTFALDPLEVRASEIALTEPRVSVQMTPEGKLNLAAIRPTDVEAPDTSPVVPAAAQRTSERLAAATRQSLPFVASVDAITISGGRVNVADQSVAPAFTTGLRDFSGSIRGLSSEELARADVDLRGLLDGVAPLRISGKINPLAQDRFSEIIVDFRGIDLPLFSPYSGKFLGQKIQKGKLRLDLNYRLSQSELVAENRIVLDQFYLGEKVASPDAVKLPIGLALAVLRERDGTIPINLPIRGNLDDPDFKYWGTVMQFIGGLVTKAATAPFKMLGGIFGGGRELDLSYVEFASGSAEFSATAAEKLETLKKALFARPGLRLEISAPPAREGDRAGLREARLQQLLAAEPTATTGDTEAAVRSLFAKQFPDEATTPTVTPSASVSPEPADEPKPPGFVQRITRRIFGRRDEAPAEPPPASTESTTPPDATASPPPLTVAEMRTRLLETIELTAADFETLASARARAIREHLLAEGTIESERIFLLDEPSIPEGQTAPPDGARVFFGLQ